jgi:hypothetical protein
LNPSQELRVVQAAQLVDSTTLQEPSWLLEGLWGAGAVGLIGGAPKSCKTWLALEMAVAAASGRPCLGRFCVPRPGPVLLYAAEDAPVQVRNRIEHIAQARSADFETLDLHLILEPSLRLDLPQHLDRLRLTLDRLRPKLLVLDPYVRLQRVDENHSTQVAAILATLRELSRSFEMAVTLVHHARKNGGDSAGQALRGSSDFHAWGDSNLYLARRHDMILLSVEHRFAASPDPLALKLVSDQGPLRLEVQNVSACEAETPIASRILEYLADHPGSCRQETLRRALRVRNQHLGEALRQLEAAGRLRRSPQGWEARNIPIPDSLPYREGNGNGS